MEARKSVAWSDDAFRARVTARADELGISLARLLESAEVSREVFYKTPTAGRRLDTLEKIAAACGWSLAELMGLAERIRVDDAFMAYESAEQVMNALPRWARDKRKLIEAYVYLYEELMRQFPRAQYVDEWQTRDEKARAHLAICVGILSRSMVGENHAARAASGTVARRRARRSVQPG